MITNIPELISHINKEIQDFTDIAVVGLSGGVDSMMVATISTLALGKENVIAVHMPYGKVDTDQGRFNANSVKIADKLGIKSLHAPVTKISDAINEMVHESLVPVVKEVHPTPEEAMSDGRQSLEPEQYAQLVRELRLLAEGVGREIV